MASPNVELVRSIYADWERGDFGSTEWAHPKIEYVTELALSRSSTTGWAGVMEATRGWMGAWERMRFSADEYRESSTTSECSCASV